jgi:hypothetical protein
MKVSEKMSDYTAACLDTPMESPCVRKKGCNIADGAMHDFGILVSPAVDRATFDHREGLNELVAGMSPATVMKVRGHGWMDNEVFVWEGTRDEFQETWELD